MPKGNTVDAAYSVLNQVFTAAPTIVSLSTSTATSALLTAGRYRITSDVDVFLKQGGSAITAATTDNPLWLKSYDYVYVTDTSDGYLAGITAAGSGSLYITRQ